MSVPRRLGWLRSVALSAENPPSSAVWLTRMLRLVQGGGLPPGCHPQVWQRPSAQSRSIGAALLSREGLPHAVCNSAPRQAHARSGGNHDEKDHLDDVGVC